MTDALLVPISAVLVSAILLGYRYGQRRELQMLRKWAERNRFELINTRPRRLLESAPFPFWTSGRMPNHFVRVRDAMGRERSGWVRLGTYASSIYGKGLERVEVKWEDPT